MLRAQQLWSDSNNHSADEMRSTLIMFVFVTLYFLVVGIVCSFWPERVNDAFKESIWDIFRAEDRRQERIFWVRTVGIGALIGFILCMLVMYGIL